MNAYLEYLTSFLPDITLTVPFVGAMSITPLLAALLVFAALTFFFKVVLIIIVNRLEVLSKKTSTDIDDALIKAVSDIHAWVYSLLAFYLAMQFFVLPETASKVLTGLVCVALTWQAIEFALHFVNYGVTRFLEKDEDGDGIIDPNAATASDMVTLIARIVLWSLGGIFVLSNLGIEVTSLIAGLGIGGIAVAFALQGILSDLFASFSLYFDKPFRIGDFIVIGSDSGNVEKIGIKTTRIRTLQGEELVVSNAELTSTRVQNFKKMERRRIVSSFGVTYETSHEQVKAIPGIVERIFQALDGATHDRVHFTTFGDSALLFEVVYYIESSDYTEYLNKQQQYNFDLMDKFAELGIDFAYPTQTLFVKKEA